MLRVTELPHASFLTAYSPRFSPSASSSAALPFTPSRRGFSRQRLKNACGRDGRLCPQGSALDTQQVPSPQPSGNAPPQGRAKQPQPREEPGDAPPAGSSSSSICLAVRLLPGPMFLTVTRGRSLALADHNKHRFQGQARGQERRKGSGNPLSARPGEGEPGCPPPSVPAPSAPGRGPGCPCPALKGWGRNATAAPARTDGPGGQRALRDGDRPRDTGPGIR